MNDFREYANYCELYHHGVKGMHWGIRRYQNKDGTLTEEGRDVIILATKKHIVSIERKRKKLEKSLQD